MFEEVYRQGTAPWDIGRPQHEFVRLSQAGEIKGTVLDIGCGTGENALYLAEQGHQVWGIDIAPTAIRKARAKAEKRGLSVHFLLGDVLELSNLGKTFDTVIDSGFFHTLSDEERPVFVRNLAAVLVPSGKYLMLCFSELETEPGGPRRVTQADIRSTFGAGWHINYIREARFSRSTDDDGARAWLASITHEA